MGTSKMWNILLGGFAGGFALGVFGLGVSVGLNDMLKKIGVPK